MATAIRPGQDCDPFSRFFLPTAFKLAEVKSNTRLLSKFKVPSFLSFICVLVVDAMLFLLSFLIQSYCESGDFSDLGCLSSVRIYRVLSSRSRRPKASQYVRLT